MDIKINFFKGLPLDSPTRSIRKAVFMDEQGFKNEFDDIDSLALHAVILCDGKPVGTARAFKENDENTYRIGRLAVLKEYRKIKLGKTILLALEDKLKEMGVTETVLSAQVRVKSFYEALGYIPFGEIYLDESCPHIAMKKHI